MRPKGINDSRSTGIQHVGLVLFHVIQTPFPDIAMHVVQPEGIGLFFTYLMGGAVGVVGEPTELIKRFNVPRCLTQFASFGASKRAFAFGAASIFPFRAGGKAINVSFGRRIFLIELSAKFAGVLPRDVFHGKIGSFCGAAWIFPGQGFILGLGNLKFAHPDITTQVN